jgi:cytochrome P450
MIAYNPYDPAIAADPYPTYRVLRDEAPVFENKDMNFWALSRHADVLEAHRDHETYSSAGGVTIEGFEAATPMLIVKDLPEHRWHKTLVTKVFTKARMAAVEPYVRDRVRMLLDQAADKVDFDFVNDFSVRLPLDVISEMLGIPIDVRGDIHHYSNMLAMRTEDNGMDEVLQAQGFLHNLYLDLIKERRLRPRDDVITLMMNSEATDQNGAVHQMDDNELAVRFAELGFAGHETVAKAIPNGAMAFNRFPDQWRRLLSGEVSALNAVDEILRYDPPSQLQGRTTTREVDLHGVTIPKGVKIMLITGSATRDERAFENPDMFDVGRENDVSAIFFGYGIHRCLGMHLARVEIRVALEELLTRFPNFSVDATRATRSVLSNVRGVGSLPAHIGQAA